LEEEVVEEVLVEDEDEDEEEDKEEDTEDELGWQWQCRRHVGDMSARQPNVGTFGQHGPVEPTQN
jgi:hypothetical protein